MAFVSVAAPAYTADNPSLILNYDEQYSADALQLRCTARGINPDFPTEFVDINTFCGPRDQKPKLGQRAFTVNTWLSYGADGSYNTLVTLERKLVTFAFLPDHTATVGVGNPEISGRCWVPNIPPFGAPSPEEPFEMSLTFQIYQTLATSTSAVVVAHPVGPITP